MTIHINVIQSNICAHQVKLNDLKEKLAHSDALDGTLQQIVHDREQAMRDRHQTYLQHKLNTFFDNAPVTASNE